ncbi:hypothetical protein [Actinoplanes aureus]|uniref:DUF3558 domain-containing protein n=1 Tax=Actinoplanes aureus TaxID=2792083 RepID=A0A931CMG6_9ACTN|nr:hypothetical protein [Actinoplanes aureus]MBG0569013.1 hypothetical protein [Actinoplanes aureus]
MISGLLVTLTAACTNGAGTAPQAAPLSTTSQSPGRTWQGFSSGCPTLTAPPYELVANGKRTSTYVSPGEQKLLGEVVPGAALDQTTCQYSEAGTLSPSAVASIKIFAQETGAMQATAWFQSEKSASSRLGGGVDFADVPGLADEAFALYREPSLRLAARSGNAYVFIQVMPGEKASRSFDKLQPLQHQLPALTAVMTDVLTGLQGR